MTLGDVIAEFRAATGLSMKQFGELAGMSKGYVSMLEHNKTQRGNEPSPSFEMYRSVAKAMKIDVNQLIRKVDGKISFEPTAPDSVSKEGFKIGQAYDQADSGIQASVRKLLGIAHENDDTFTLTSAAYGEGIRQIELTSEEVKAAQKAAAKLHPQADKK